jgi:hypothetical protein
MEIGTVVVALILVFIAWKVLTGLIKAGVIVLVIAAAAYFLLGGF